MRVRTSRAARLFALMAAGALAFAMVLPSAFGADSGTGSPKSGGVSGNVSTQAEGSVSASAAGGPVVIMGIDAEDGGIGGHGPIANYISVANSILANATNGGTGLLVIGGGKDTTPPVDDVTEFWNAVAAGAGVTVTYVNGAANIASQSFNGFKMIGVASGDSDTSSGGLTALENDALTTRQADIATFVNTGGGLLVFSQGFDDPSTPYGFLGAIGSFTFTTGGGYSDIDPTPDGIAIGVTNALDVSAWHDTYLTYPSFLVPLAFPSGVTTAVAALGGLSVFIGPRPVEVVPTFTG